MKTKELQYCYDNILVNNLLKFLFLKGKQEEYSLKQKEFV